MGEVGLRSLAERTGHWDWSRAYVVSGWKVPLQWLRREAGVGFRPGCPRRCVRLRGERGARPSDVAAL